MKNEYNLTVKQKKELELFLIDCSLDTVKAYQLKSGFDQLWKVQNLAIMPLMESWIIKALAINLKPIDRFVKSVKNNIQGILNAIKTGITNAVSEGLNSVMQLARSTARGFRNINNFCDMIYFLGNH